MLKKTVTYTDFDGNPVTEDLYFNISKSQWIEIELNGFDLPDGTHVDSYGGYLQSLVPDGADSKIDAKSMITAVKQLIGMAYGVRNGSKFEKSDQISADFIGSQAYDEFFWTLAMDPDAAASFMTSLVPQEIMSKAEEIMAQGGVKVPVKVPTTMTSAPLVPQTIQLPPAPDTSASPATPAAFGGPARPGMRKGHQPLQDNTSQPY